MLKNLTSLQKLVRGLKIVFISTFLLVFLTIPQKSYTRDQISQGRIYPSQRPSLRSGGSSSRPAYQKPWQKSPW